VTNAADFSFRSEVRPADRQQIREIVESTGFFHPWEVDIALELADERLSKGSASGYEFLFADDQGRTDGYACFGEIPCTRGSYDIYWIAVRRECQGKGLGRRLMQLVEQQIRGLAGRRIYLETSGRSDYLPTRSFYERCQYQLAAELPDFYAPGDAKIIYVKCLDI